MIHGERNDSTVEPRGCQLNVSGQSLPVSPARCCRRSPKTTRAISAARVLQSSRLVSRMTDFMGRILSRPEFARERIRGICFDFFDRDGSLCRIVRSLQFALMVTWVFHFAHPAPAMLIVVPAVAPRWLGGEHDGQMIVLRWLPGPDSNQRPTG